VPGVAAPGAGAGRAAGAGRDTGAAVGRLVGADDGAGADDGVELVELDGPAEAGADELDDEGLYDEPDGPDDGRLLDDGGPDGENGRPLDGGREPDDDDGGRDDDEDDGGRLEDDGGRDE
jgi:hypothetical protein